MTALLSDCDLRGHRFRKLHPNFCAGCGGRRSELLYADDPAISVARRDDPGWTPIITMPEVRNLVLAGGDPGHALGFRRERDGGLVVRVRLRREVVARFAIPHQAASMLRIFLTVTDPDFVSPRTLRR